MRQVPKTYVKEDLIKLRISYRNRVCFIYLDFFFFFFFFF